MIVTPTILAGLACAGPAVSTLLSYLVARCVGGRAASRALGRAREQRAAGIDEAAQQALTSLQVTVGEFEALAGRARQTVQAAAEQGQQALELAQQAKATAAEAASCARAGAGQAEQSRAALNEVVQNARVSAAQIQEILSLAREHDGDTAPQRTRRDKSRRQQRGHQREEPVLNGAGNGTPDGAAQA